MNSVEQPPIAGMGEEIGGQSAIAPSNGTANGGVVQPEQEAKSCLELDALFSGLNHFFRDEDILKESEHSSLLLGNLIFFAYLLVIAFGSVGNLLTILAVLRNKQMHTVRNFFIVNLAMSDFFVCTVTAPTTLYTVLYVFWPFSRTMCKFAGSLQGFNIFLSTFSITAIALDRYVLVIFPTKRQRQQRLSLMFFALIWLSSILLAAPLFLAADISPIFRDEQCGIELNLCNEQNDRWKELLLSKEAYTVGVIILQYLLPLVAIAFAYSRIARRMGARKTRCGSGGGSRKNSPPNNVPISSHRNSLCPTPGSILASSQSCTGVNQQLLVNGQANGSAPTAEILLIQRRKSIADRHRRTNMLLVTLVVVFACAWLPLNIFHLFNTFSKTASFSVPIFALCHLTAMCSACLNPCCYAFFNNNFRQEFIDMYRKVGLIWLYRRMANFAKFIGLNGATGDKSTAISDRATLPICQTRTELLVAHKKAFEPIAAPLDHHQQQQGPTPMLAPPQPRGGGGEQRRVSIQDEAIRMDF